MEDYGEEEAFIKTVEDDVLENKYSSEEENIIDSKVSQAEPKANATMKSISTSQ
jgi:hypothetical protein